MSKVGRWSQAAGSNNQATPDGWPEGQLPSTVNDCAREMMAAIRTALLDLQYIDQDFTPTFINATTFSIPGNQTSAIHIGRRLKMFDATAGVAQTIYGTVNSVSFTAVTTIHIAADAGSLTSSLSSFGISIIGNPIGNNSLPRNLDLTVSSIAVGNMSVSGTIAANALNANTMSISGAAAIGGTLSVSGTVVAANVARVFGRVFLSAGGAALGANSTFNVASASRSAVGVLRINFSNALANTEYCTVMTSWGGGVIVSPSDLSFTAASVKLTLRQANNNSAVDSVFVNFAVYRT